MLLTLWVMTPLGVEWPFHRVTYQISCISHICIIIHNSSKIAVMKLTNEIMLWLEVTISWRTELKGHSIWEVENHSFRPSFPRMSLSGVSSWLFLLPWVPLVVSSLLKFPKKSCKSWEGQYTSSWYSVESHPEKQSSIHTASSIFPLFSGPMVIDNLFNLMSWLS